MATGAAAVSLVFAVGIPLNNAQQGAVAQARTVEVLQATATRIAEQKIRTTLAVDVTIPVSREQMNAVSGYAIPLHEQAPTAEVIGASPTYNETVYPTSIPSLAVVPPDTAPVSAGIYAAAGGTVTPAAATPIASPSAWPSGTPSATPVVLVVETLAATADESTWAAIFTATPTPYPTDAPTITEHPTPWPTVAPIHTSTPQPSDTNTPTIEPSATEAGTITPEPIVTVTDGPLTSPLATPVPEKTETPAP